MEAANLIIDIGNTAVKAAWADGMTLGKTFRYQGERMLDFILSLTEKTKPHVMILSSVRMFSRQAMERLRKECSKLVVVDEDVLQKHDVPSYLTPDRAASARSARGASSGAESASEYRRVPQTSFARAPSAWLFGQ